MTAIQLNAEILRNLSVLAEDENMLKRVAKYLRKLVAEKETNTVVGEENTANKSRLYDPETGEYLNEKTMKAIEEAHDDMKQGRLKSYESVDAMFQDLGI